MMAWSGFESKKTETLLGRFSFFPPLRRFFADHTLVERLKLAGSSSVWNLVYSGDHAATWEKLGGKDLL